MLSVLVPIYNFDVTSFVEELRIQCNLAHIDFEIICFDDCSELNFRKKNQQLNRLEKVNYKELNTNVGRSKIRNLLAKEASFEKLLFVDCDSKIESDEYILNYLKCIDSSPIIYGGRSYSSNPPDDLDLYLRWYYGVKREVKNVENRNKEPYRNFMTNNFIIDKQLVIKTPFNEFLSGYGYEDLLFAMELKKLKIPILHIDNPLQHVGLEKNIHFLEKTKNGMINLSKIINKNNDINEIKIARYYHSLNRFHLNWIVALLYNILHNKIEKSLNEKKTNLLYFDLFKLHFLIIEMKKLSDK